MHHASAATASTLTWSVNGDNILLLQFALAAGRSILFSGIHARPPWLFEEKKCQVKEVQNQ
jgi:hypothetical protein